jgi:hypothetical protein
LRHGLIAPDLILAQVAAIENNRSKRNMSGPYI